MFTDKNGREVEITETDFEMGEGVTVIDAVYTDTGEHVDDDTLWYLTDAYQMELYEDAVSDRASAAYDRYKDLYKYGE